MNYCCFVSGKESGRAASILLGMIGKGKRVGSESSNSVEEDPVSPKNSLKVKLLKYGQRKPSTSKVEDEEIESEADRERVEKAAAILGNVMSGKKKPLPNLLPLPNQLIING